MTYFMVQGESGTWDSHTTWPVAIYEDHKGAIKHVEEVTKEWKTLLEEHGDKLVSVHPSVFDFELKLDPFALIPIGYGAGSMKWSVIEVPGGLF